MHTARASTHMTFGLGRYTHTGWVQKLNVKKSCTAQTDFGVTRLPFWSNRQMSNGLVNVWKCLRWTGPILRNGIPLLTALVLKQTKQNSEASATLLQPQNPRQSVSVHPTPACWCTRSSASGEEQQPAFRIVTHCARNATHSCHAGQCIPCTECKWLTWRKQAAMTLALTGVITSPQLSHGLS